MSIDYSDGNIENTILELLKKEQNLSSSNEISKELYSNWPIRYHLSSIRSNCIKHLNLDGLEVLEFGAGMGAISRYFAENAKFLTVVEGTQQRFNCLSERLRDLKNWEGVVKNYQDFNSTKKYDIVCFSGVLEYAGLYINEKDPFQWALNHAKSFLKEDGVILVTIENKNGLKYFSGATEDHLGTHYSGICGYSKINGIKTFSKIEMENLFKSIGMNSVDTHHLWPDYKCTRAMLTDEMVKEYPQISANIAGSYEFEDYSELKQNLFPEKLAVMSLANSNLLGEFSNSYLFIASENDNSKIKKHLLSKIENENIKASLYTQDRKYNVLTKFKNQNNELIVEKSFMNEQAPQVIEDNSTKISIDNFHPQKTIKGDDLLFLLLNYAYYSNWEEFGELLENFFKFSFEKYKTENSNEIQSKSFDALIHNTIVDSENNFNNFDLEYTLDKNITKSYFIFRNLSILSNYLRYFNNAPFKSLHELYLNLCQKFDLQFDLKSEIEFEVNIQLLVTNWEATYEAYNSGFMVDISEISSSDDSNWMTKKIKKLRKQRTILTILIIALSLISIFLIFK